MRERTQQEILWFMDEWRRCTTLDPFERSLLDQMAASAAVSTAAFWEKADLFRSHLLAPLLNAANKAREQGLCKSWPC